MLNEKRHSEEMTIIMAKQVIPFIFHYNLKK